jgi:hypothetical protein
MNPRTGNIHKVETKLEEQPEAVCSKCHGSGRRKAGQFSKRFVACECTRVSKEIADQGKPLPQDR